MSRKREIPNKIITVHFRCTEEEAAIIKKKSISNGYNQLSQYIRDRCLIDNEIVINTSEFLNSLLELNGELNRIGNNINQFTKGINIEIKTNSKMSEQTFNNMVSQIYEYNAIMRGFDKDIKKLLRHTSRARRLK